jgi:hypothetical protein
MILADEILALDSNDFDFDLSDRAGQFRVILRTRFYFLHMFSHRNKVQNDKRSLR